MSTGPETITAYPTGTWKADPVHSEIARIDRRDFGIATALAMARGGVVIGYEVSVSLQVQAVRRG